MHQLNQHQKLAVKAMCFGFLLSAFGYLLAFLFHKSLEWPIGTYLSVALFSVGCIIGVIGGCIGLVGTYHKDTEK